MNEYIALVGVLGMCAISGIVLYSRLDKSKQMEGIVYSQFIGSIFALVASVYYALKMHNSLSGLIDISNNPIILATLCIVVNSFTIYLYNKKVNAPKKDGDMPFQTAALMLMVAAVLIGMMKLTQKDVYINNRYNRVNNRGNNMY
tara:strand:+ start:400 stop:834 length:435 start_codon:yes stop_codon:yes gene_type:complete